MMTMEQIYRAIQAGKVVPHHPSLLNWSIQFAKKHKRLPTWEDVKQRGNV